MPLIATRTIQKVSQPCGLWGFFLWQNGARFVVILGCATRGATRFFQPSLYDKQVCLYLLSRASFSCSPVRLCSASYRVMNRNGVAVEVDS